MNQKGSVPTGKDDEGKEKYEFDALPIHEMRKTAGPNVVNLARKEIIAGADWRYDKLLSLGPNESLVRGGTSAITQLEKWANSGGKAPIPSRVASYGYRTEGSKCLGYCNSSIQTTHRQRFIKSLV